MNSIEFMERHLDDAIEDKYAQLCKKVIKDLKDREELEKKINKAVELFSKCQQAQDMYILAKDYAEFNEFFNREFVEGADKDLIILQDKCEELEKKLEMAVECIENILDVLDGSNNRDYVARILKQIKGE